MLPWLLVPLFLKTVTISVRANAEGLMTCPSHGSLAFFSWYRAGQGTVLQNVIGLIREFDGRFLWIVAPRLGAVLLVCPVIGSYCRRSAAHASPRLSVRAEVCSCVLEC